MQPNGPPFAPVDPEARQRWMMEEDGRTLGRLLSDLTADFSTLLRKEIELARVETTEKVTMFTKSLVWMVIGGLIVYSGFLVLIAGLVMVLSTVMSPWLAALACSLGLIVIGMLCLQAGRSAMQRISILPEHAIESLKEDAELVKEKVS